MGFILPRPLGRGFILLNIYPRPKGRGKGVNTDF